MEGEGICERLADEADGHLIVLGEEGRLALVEATPAGYREKASAQVMDGRSWTMPTLANGRLYLRDQLGDGRPRPGRQPGASGDRPEHALTASVLGEDGKVFVSNSLGEERCAS